MRKPNFDKLNSIRPVEVFCQVSALSHPRDRCNGVPQIYRGKVFLAGYDIRVSVGMAPLAPQQKKQRDLRHREAVTGG
ncbi:hypothetical protein XA68_12328 [Ophiocordyceps unilateralis]|uniref:Uncharacterized protein n=1 Tax=Ophiocordyceps unilateralis TaxID=268505 RepID=A0A2A9PQV6_OPHUN|nr:hypothetical protein XA68_12328 [Ophiocordyceps unilateralis]